MPFPGIRVGLAEALYDVGKVAPGKVVQGSHSEKTEQDLTRIKKALDTNRLIRYMDADQKSKMIDSVELVKYRPGDVIIEQGAEGDYFFAMDNGAVDIVTDNVLIKTYDGPGKSFGEQGMVYNTRRSASVVARTKCYLWRISRPDFYEALHSSQRLTKVWATYSSVGPDDEQTMVFDDFLASLGMEALDGRSNISKKRLKFLFSMADSDKSGALSFKEFALFDILLQKPEPEYDISFRLFDKKNDGVVDLEEFKQTMQSEKKNNMFNFDYSCNLVKRYFGADGKTRLRYSDFGQFFSELQQEVARQMFANLKNKNGVVTSQDFYTIIAHYGNGKVPEGLEARLGQVANLSSAHGNNIISFPEFCAFLNLLDHLPGVLLTLQNATDHKRGPINRDEFKEAAKKTLLHNCSPMEVDVIFTLFDLDRNGLISTDDFRDVMAKTRVDHKDGPRDQEQQETLDVIGHEETKSAMGHFLETVEHFILGAVAGGAGASAVYPIDLIKTRMQNQRTEVGGGPPRYANFFDCLRQTVKAEGLGGLYRGIGPQLIGVAPEKAIKLAVNDLFRSLFANPNNDGKIYFPLEVLAGGFAGASQVVFTNPLEIVKIRLQVQGELIKEGAAPKGAVQICRELGFGGLYKGASACFLRDIPFSAIYFPAYAEFKRKLADENGKLTPANLLLAGALAGMPAASLTTPADVIKTRLQVELRPGEKAYKDIQHAAYTIARQEGVSALFKGAGARVFRSSPQFGVTLLVYELLQSWLAPDLPSRPPVNAPVTQTDLSDFDWFRKQKINTKLGHVSDALRNIRT